jgi:Protein of unknown function (DUF4065)
LIEGREETMPTTNRASNASDAKLKELALYIAKLSEEDERFGRTKLQKELFTADFLAYAKLGKSITGQTYAKRELGPCVKRWPVVRDEMLDARDAAEQKRTVGDYEQFRLIALRDPDLTQFSGEEVAIAQHAVKAHEGRGGKDVSDWSHCFLGWRLARVGETIPYETILIASSRPLSGSAEAWVRDLADSIAAA